MQSTDICPVFMDLRYYLKKLIFMPLHKSPSSRMCLILLLKSSQAQLIPKNHPPNPQMPHSSYMPTSRRTLPKSVPVFPSFYHHLLNVNKNVSPLILFGRKYVQCNFTRYSVLLTCAIIFFLGQISFSHILLSILSSKDVSNMSDVQI